MRIHKICSILRFVGQQARRRARNRNQILASERETAELREQFIAVLGHDLRNPLATINAGACILQRSGNVKAEKDLRTKSISPRQGSRCGTIVLVGGLNLFDHQSGPNWPMVQ
jgi:signal transduction histidine kinase